MGNKVYYKMGIVPRESREREGIMEQWLEYHCGRDKDAVTAMRSMARAIRVESDDSLADVKTAMETAEFVMRVQQEVRDYSLHLLF